MPLEISRSHHLDKATTRRMVEQMVATLNEKLPFTYRWNGDRLHFEQVGIKGHIDIADHQVRVFVNKSPLLPVSETWIREQVEATMDQYLST